MLSVTFQAPIIIDAANLNSLLSLANTPALVESYVAAPVADVAAPVKRTRKPAGSSPAAATGDKPKRTRATKAEMEARRAAAAGGAPETPADPPEEEVKDPVVAPPPVVLAADKPKRDRRSAAKKAADAAKEAGKAAPAAKPKADPKPKAGAAKGADAADTAALQDRFAQLIDKSFEQATALLAEFGVKRFSEVEAGKLGDFGAKLTELGV